MSLWWLLLIVMAVSASFDSPFLEQYLHYNAEFDTLSDAVYLNHSNHCLNNYYTSSNRIYRNPPRFCRLKNQQEYDSEDTSNAFTKISPRAIVATAMRKKDTFTGLPVHSLLCNYHMKARGEKLIAQDNYLYLIITQSDCNIKNTKASKSDNKATTGYDNKAFNVKNGGAAIEVISIPVALNTEGQMRMIKTIEGDALSANCRVTDRVDIAGSYEVQCPMYRGDMESLEDVRKCIYVKAFLDYEHYDAFNELMGTQRPFRAGIPGTGLYCDRAMKAQYKKGSLPYDTIESIMMRDPEKDYPLSYRPHMNSAAGSSTSGGGEMKFTALTKEDTHKCLLNRSRPVYFLGDSHSRYLFDAILLKYIDMATQGAASTALKKGPHHHPHLDIHQSIFYRPVRFVLEFIKILEHMCFRLESTEKVTLVIQLGSWDLDYAPISNLLKDTKHMPLLLKLVKEIMNGENDCTSRQFRFVFMEAPPFPVMKQYRYMSTGSVSDRSIDERRKEEDRERFEKNKVRVQSNLNSDGDHRSQNDGPDLGIGSTNMTSADLEEVWLHSSPPQKLSMDIIDTTITSNSYSGFRNDYNLAVYNEYLHREIDKIKESVKGSNHSIEVVNMYQALFPYRDDVLCATHYMCLNLQKNQDLVDMDFTRGGYLFMENFLKQLCIK